MVFCQLQSPQLCLLPSRISRPTQTSCSARTQRIRGSNNMILLQKSISNFWWNSSSSNNVQNLIYNRGES
ncbi:hypothetical protein F383_16871 [Gossypium arboreum]|uniref:Uncharacterized protein n=1 Tax=Gossypium arboreum TaxID=29729 RepID=A0A0B0NLT8_GOSAR|nr:hypothetical protein F383_16871 [Gossypium arboreum]